MGLGMGTAFMPAMSLATHGVRPEDAGVASAMVNTSQQVGGSIGTALLNTLATSASATWVSSHLTSKGDLTHKLFVNQSLVHGYSVAIYWATAILALSSVLAFVLVNAGVQSGPERVDGDKSADDFAIPVIAH
jgi:MFS family permease